MTMNDKKRTTAAMSDQITSLPGAPAFLSKQYSGFLPITGTKNIHYFYIESEGDPVKDSVVFWTNGGPGCSGLLGLFLEMGPWRVQSDGTVLSNPASWTGIASMVFLEQPAGVGYSTTTNPDELSSNDFKAARDNLLTIKEFFKRYPERANNTIYLASESYGGHYVPQLTLAMLADKEISKNFHGYLVGNPYVSFGSGDIATVNTLWGLQLIDYPLWHMFTISNCDRLDWNAYSLPDECVNTLYAMMDETAALNPYALGFPVCAPGFDDDARAKEKGRKLTKRDLLWSNSAQHRTLRNIHSNFMAYRESRKADMEKRNFRTGEEVAVSVEVLEPVSTLGVDNTVSNIVGTAASTSTFKTSTAATTSTTSSSARSSSSSSDKQQDISPPISAVSFSKRAQGVWKAPPVTKIGLDYDACSEGYTIGYLNRQDVQYALHVIPKPTSPAVNWGVCSGAVSQRWSLTDVYSDTSKLYPQIYRKVTEQRRTGERTSDFKMLVFSGDADGVCATIGTQHWIYAVTEPSAVPPPMSLSASSADPSRPVDTLGSLSTISSLWQPWVIVDGQPDIDILTGAATGRAQGGFITKFEGSFTFATVHHAGHEVPAYQPLAALSLFSGFIDGSMFTPSATTANESAVNSRLAVRNTTIVVGASIILGVLGLVLVCYFMYAKERRMRRSSAGPPVSMIETDTADEEYEGRKGPGTLTTRVSSPSRSHSSGGQYVSVSLASEESSL